ncbi:MAG: single-stranded DNA-binding protein [Rhodomicrobium sp.]|jgi:single-strand DNA-binding protein
MNEARLVGNLGADPEIKATSNGKTMASFSVATTEKWKDKQTGEEKQDVQWHKIAVFEPNLVEFAKGLKKGSFVRLEGRIVNQKYTGADGQERFSSQIQLSGPRALLIAAGRQNENGHSR